MGLASVGGGGYSPRPYEIGGSDLVQARSDIEKLNALKVTTQNYKNADPAHGWGGIFSGLDSKVLIARQTQLEDDASKHLFNIAAANERGQVSPTLLKAAQDVGGDLQSRQTQDYNNAYAAAPSDDNPQTLTAWARAHPLDDQNVQDALAFGNKPDVIPLSDTASFMKQVDAFHGKLKNDIDSYEYPTSKADREAAKARLSGADSTELQKLYDKVEQQTGFTSLHGSRSKIASLPDGDPQKAAYIKQSDDLTNLIQDGGTLFNDNTALLDALKM